jgi:hypothetical protein
VTDRFHVAGVIFPMTSPFVACVLDFEARTRVISLDQMVDGIGNGRRTLRGAQPGLKVLSLERELPQEAGHWRRHRDQKEDNVLCGGWRRAPTLRTSGRLP